MSSFSISALHSPFEAITPVLDKSSSHHTLTTPTPPPTSLRGGPSGKPAKAYPPPRLTSSVYSSYHHSVKTHQSSGSWTLDWSDNESSPGRPPLREFTNYSLPPWDDDDHLPADPLPSWDGDRLPAHPLPPHFRPQPLLTTDHIRRPVRDVFGPPQEEMPGSWPKGPCRKSAPGWGVNQGYMEVLITPDEWREGEGGLRGYRYEGKGRGTMADLRPCDPDYWMRTQAEKKKKWWRRLGRGIGKVFCFR